MKRAVIFLNGTIRNYKVIPVDSMKDAFVICVDGGARHALRLGLTPDVVLGDFDSLSAQLKKKLQNMPSITWIAHLPKKNQYETDAELALSYAIDKKHTSLQIFGFSGSRLDHMMANIGLFARFAQKNIRISIYEKNQALHFVRDNLEVLGNKNDTLSLIPLSQTVVGVTTTGVRWNLENATLPHGSTLGVSNQLIREKAKVTIQDGILLIVLTTHSLSSKL